MKKAIISLMTVVISATLVATTYAMPSHAEAAYATSAQALRVSTASISEKDALAIALRDAKLKKTQITHIETECKKNKIEIEFTHKKKLTEYEYEIALNEGSILSKEVEFAYKHNSSTAKIGKKAALKKVAKFSGISYSKIKKARCTYRYKKNEGTYTVKFSYKGHRYEYKLLAPTGKVIEWEKIRAS